MKQLLVLLALVIFTNTIRAQSTFISSDNRQSCYWDSTEQKFSLCEALEEFTSLFTLNAGESMFVHTTPTMKSSYYVKSKTYSAETDTYSYDVLSDVGNKYQFILGKNAANFVILSTGHASSSQDYIMKFPIKKKWSE